jgi:hypothetical protein
VVWGIATEPSFQTTALRGRFGASICPFVGAVFNGFVQVYPIAIEAFDHFEFPVSFPCFDLRFAADGFWHGGVVFIPDEFAAVVVRREPFEEFFLVGGYAVVEIAGHAGIDGSTIAAGNDINGRNFFFVIHSALPKRGSKLQGVYLAFGMTAFG